MGDRTERLLRELAASIREDIGALPCGVGTLQDELATARANARMSLQEVADASGFTKSHVWEIEQGRSRNPTISLIDGLSKALGIPFLRLAQAALNTQQPAPPLTQAQRDNAPYLPDQKPGEIFGDQERNGT